MADRIPTHFARILALLHAASRPPPGGGRIALALGAGVICHASFALAVAAMILAMGFGMSKSFVQVPGAWAWGANLLLLMQFPALHSIFLTRAGQAVLARLAPQGSTLATTTYASIASVQLFALFAFWTPSGVVWIAFEGGALWLSLLAYAASWLFLIKASWDAGAEVQSGALGWLSLMAARRPIFPDMPETGTFRYIRQPIYLAFALTTWCVPVWTPDQLLLASVLSAYCLLAPIKKERRMRARHGARFDAYAARVPYMIPRLHLPRRERARAK
jgi:protein-S-isoprenylcysteine O-methyltransferase Ste14